MGKLFVGVVVGVVACVVYKQYVHQNTTTETNNDKQPDIKRPEKSGCCYDVAIKGGLLHKRKMSLA